MSELGRIAFEAYSKSVGGKTYDNKPIPAWDDLTDQVRAGWTTAAAEVAERLSQITQAAVGMALDDWANRTLPRNFFRKS